MNQVETIHLLLLGFFSFLRIVLIGIVNLLVMNSCKCFAALILAVFSHRMFIDSCKKLKIMKGSDAIGLGIVEYFIILLTTNSVFAA